MKIKIIVIGISLFSLFTTNAQVTVGSDLEPRKGTLLDMKENTKTGKEANASKGFGLPRVALKSLSDLTVVADNSKGDDYVGLTVYNVTSSGELSEGIYCWFGNAWKQVVMVDNPGSEGNLLKSIDGNMYSWTNITIPEYDFAKPTQKVLFDSEKAKDSIKKYTYEDIAANSSNAGDWTPDQNQFKDHFVYIDTLNIKSGINAEKYVLLQFTANITKKTINDEPVAVGFWEKLLFEVLVTDKDDTENKRSKILKTYERTLSTPVKSVANSTVALFSIVPLTDLKLDKDKYALKLRISNTSNNYSKNIRLSSGNNDGRFQNGSASFLEISVSNFGFILYEEE